METLEKTLFFINLQIIAINIGVNTIEVNIILDYINTSIS